MYFAVRAACGICDMLAGNLASSVPPTQIMVPGAWVRAGTISSQ